MTTTIEPLGARGMAGPVGLVGGVSGRAREVSGVTVESHDVAAEAGPVGREREVAG